MVKKKACIFISGQGSNLKNIILHSRVSNFPINVNLVVSNNKNAINLWKSVGFEIVGRLPLAFHHPTDGLIDALVMFKNLNDK